MSLVPRKTSYNVDWEKERNWLTSVVREVHMAHCKACNKSFRIDASGVSQVNSHARSDAHKKHQVD